MALARTLSNDMPLSEHDAEEVRRMLYLRAEGIKNPRATPIPQTDLEILHLV